MDNSHQQNSIRPDDSDFEFSAFQQECVQDGVISYRVQASKKPSIVLQALLKLPAYDNPEQPAHVTQRRQQLVNIAKVLTAAGQKGGGYLPAVIQVGHMVALQNVIEAGLARQCRLNEPYILLEQPIGMPLSTVYESLYPEDAATIIIRIAYGVDALHKAGWVHGSLAPDKIYVSVDRALGTLAYFGTVTPEANARIVVTEPLRKSQYEGFSAPEIQTQKKVNKKIDVYALGMLLYRLLVGSDPLSVPHAINKYSPFTRLMNTIYRVGNQLDKNLRFPKMGTVPERFAEVIYNATALEPKTRYSTVSEFIQAVGKAVSWATATFSPQTSSHTQTSNKGLLSKGDFLHGGHYRIKGVFASGNQGVIYEAWKKPCGTNTDLPNIPVLIKCAQYNYQGCQDDKIGHYIIETRQQIEHEAKMLQRLHGSLAVTPQLIDLFYEQTYDPVIKARAPSLLKNEPYVVMSQIAAASLETIDKPEPMVAIRIGYRLAETLAAVHARQVLYQDIKPGNILVDQWGSSIFLVDLGAVCPIINGELQESSPAYGNVTPGYQGPEFDELWQKTDYRFDIYSMGATWFFLLTGVCPLRDLYVPAFNKIETDRNELRHKKGTLDKHEKEDFDKRIRDAERPFLATNQLPALVRPVIAQFLERDRDKRCQDAKTAAQMLRQLARELSGHPIPAPIILRAECFVPNLQGLPNLEGFSRNKTFLDNSKHNEPACVEIECHLPRDIAITNIVLTRMVADTQTIIVRHQVAQENTFILRDPDPLPGVISYQIQAETKLDNITSFPAFQQIAYAPSLKVSLIEKPGAIIIRWLPMPSAKSYVILRHNSHIPENIQQGTQIGEEILDTHRRFIEDKTVLPGNTYFYAVIARYSGNIYSPSAGGAVTPHSLPVTPEILEWTTSPETSQCFLDWKQTKPLPDCYIVKELDAFQKELGTFEVETKGFCPHGHVKGISKVSCPSCGEPLILRYTVSTSAGEKRWLRIASRMMDVYSGWASGWVAGYVPISELQALPPQAERVILHWLEVPGVLYQIERQTDNTWQQIARIDAPPFIDENIMQGDYHYHVQAVVRLVANDEKYFGFASVKARVLEAVPLPAVQVNLQQNVLNLSWQFSEHAPAHKVSGVQVFCDVDNESLYNGKIARSDSLSLVVPNLPIGIPVTVRVWGVLDEQLSPRPVIKWVVPTVPVEALQVEPLIEQAKLCWEMPPNADYCVVYRQTEVGTVTVSERSYNPFFIDTDVPTDIAVTYNVKPVFQNGVMGCAKTTSTVIVPPQPQVPQNICWLQEQNNLGLKWQLPPDIRYTSGWQIMVYYQNDEQMLEVSRGTTFVTLTNLPPWVPIYIQVRALVGTQAGQLAAQCVGGITEKLTVEIKAAINEVNLQWAPPPLPGQLVVSREGGGKPVKFVVPANDQFYVELPSQLDTEYWYAYYFELKHPEIGTLTTKSSSPQKVFPRAYPINIEGPTVELHKDGQHVRLSWPSESNDPSVDSYLYLRKTGTEPFPTDPFDVKQLAALIQQDNVTVIPNLQGLSNLEGFKEGLPNLEGFKRDSPPNTDYIPHFGVTYQYAIVALNSLVAKISPAVSVTSIPQVSIESVHFGEIQTTIVVKKLPVWQVVMRRVVADMTTISPKITERYETVSNLASSAEYIQMPCMLLTQKAHSLTQLLENLSTQLQLEGEGIQLLPPGIGKFIDISLAADNVFNYHLLSLVNAADDPNKYFISAYPETLQPTDAGTGVIYEFGKRRQWLRQVYEVWYWVVATDLPLKWTFQLASGKTIDYKSSKPAGKFILPAPVDTVQILTAEGDEVIGQNSQHLPIAGKQPLPVRMSFWLAQQWFQINRHLILTKILELCPPETELAVQPMNLGKIKVLIPKALGDGDLLFIPKSIISKSKKSQNSRPVVQVFRNRPWRLRTKVVDIFCDEEPWLNLTGASMQKILGSL